MVSMQVKLYRGKIVESKHAIKCLVKNLNGRNLLSTNNQRDLIFPRSAVKIFQALPFVDSDSIKLFNLNNKNIALSCSSHHGEAQHLSILKKWLKKIKIDVKEIKCGIHNPISHQSSNKLLLNREKPNQLHHNCAGKHLAMISGCIAYKINHYDYINFNHPYQILIRNCLEFFTNSKIKNINIGIDGCNAPQYAFTIESLAYSMINLIKTVNKKNQYTKSIKKILLSIRNNPLLIGGSNSFDSNVMKITGGRIFCKGGAEGVLLFADFKKKIGGVIKVVDGNERARPLISLKIFTKLNLISKKEEEILKKLTIQKIPNGKIFAEIRQKIILV